MSSLLSPSPNPHQVIVLPEVPIPPNVPAREVDVFVDPDDDLRENIIKQWLNWRPVVDYLNFPTMVLPQNACTIEEWKEYASRFEAYLRSHPYAYKFWMMGYFQIPGEIIPNSEFQQQRQGRNLSSDIDGSNSSNGRSSSGGQQTSFSKMKCKHFPDHPIFHSFIVPDSVNELQLAVDFYLRNISFIWDVFRYGIEKNHKAASVMARLDKGDYRSLFSVAKELHQLFSAVSTGEARFRRGAFGAKLISETNCNNLEDFIAYLYEERKWIMESFREWKSDEDMLHAAIAGLSLSEKYSKAFNFLIDRQNSGAAIQFDVIIEALRSYIRQTNFWASGLNENQKFHSGSTQITKKMIRNHNQNNYLGFRTNMKSVQSNQRVSRVVYEIVVPDNLKYKFVDKQCRVCGVTGHMSSHHKNKEVAKNMSYKPTPTHNLQYSGGNNKKSSFNN